MIYSYTSPGTIFLTAKKMLLHKICTFMQGIGWFDEAYVLNLFSAVVKVIKL